MLSTIAVAGIQLLLAGSLLSGADVGGAIERYVRAEIELNDLPGAAVAVWRKGEIIYAEGFGVRSVATRELMTADTLVDLASVSKSLTAVGIAELSRQGKLEIDAPVAKYLPEGEQAFRRVRLRHLLRHTSGLTRRDDALAPCCEHAPERQLELAVERLATSKRSGSTGSEFVYANSNYILLAAIVQRVSGQPFPLFMREAVFTPLGMHRTTLDAAEASSHGIAEPHERLWRSVHPSRSPFLGWYGSSLVKSTAREMAAYLGHVLSRRGRHWAEPYDSGWFVRRRREWPGNPLLVEHGGNTWGGNTAAVLVPAWGVGAVVLLNVGANRAVDIARGVAALAAGLPAPRPQRDRHSD